MRLDKLLAVNKVVSIVAYVLERGATHSSKLLASTHKTEAGALVYTVCFSAPNCPSERTWQPLSQPLTCSCSRSVDARYSM
jgi:hypothetical protein